MDLETLTHRAWLGYVQPVGLVVSVPALLAAQAYIDRALFIPQHKTFLDFLESTSGLTISQSLEHFVRDVLEWQEGDLIPLQSDTKRQQSFEVVRHEYSETLTPTHVVDDPDSANNPELPPLILVKCYEKKVWMAQDENPFVDFDKIEGQDTKSWQATPQQKFERLLRENHVPIGILFNGSEFRLVYAPRGESSGYITFRFEDMKTIAGRPILAGLVLLLHTDRVCGGLGENQRLPHILAESRKYQNDVSTKLADQVMLALFELLRGFQAAHALRKIDALEKSLNVDPNSVYGGLLTVLLRLVFVLYAEDRGLMSGDPDYTKHYSVTGLFEKLRVDFGKNPDTMDLRYGAWSQLLTLFRLIHHGGKNGPFDLPERKGHLFNSDRFPFLEGGPCNLESNESESRPAFERVPRVSDGVVYRVLEKLLILDGERLSYRTLDVEQIGSVYEAIMGFHLETAKGLSIAIKPIKSGGAPSTIDLDELLETKPSEREKKIQVWTDQKLTGKDIEAMKGALSTDDLLAALQRKIDSRITPEPVPQGSMILQPSDERRRSGSHYTPRQLTEPIVQMTLQPLFESFGTKIVSEQILSMKICDPAMGSGAFLVEACRQLGDKLVETWHKNGNTPKNIPADEDELLYARRIIAQRCLYGVDINPMATDLAKLSLWLVTLAKNHAFTFLDHCLRSGDSLVGLTKKQITGFHWKPSGQQDFLSKTIDDGIRPAIKERKEILDAKDSMLYGVLEAKLKVADAALETVRFVGDTVCAALFAGAKEKQRLEKLAEFRLELFQYFRGEIKPGKSLRPDMLVDAVEKMRSGSRPIRPFHWEIEFPEVFMPSNDTKSVGFDAVIGNPPYIQLQKNGGELSTIYERFSYQTFDKTGDIYCLFYELGHNLLRPGGVLGFITSNKWMRAGYGENTREFLAKKTNPFILVDFAGVNAFESATVDVNVLLFSKEKNRGQTLCAALQKDCAKKWSDFLRQNGAAGRFDTKDSWVILSPIEQRIKTKIEAVGTPLKKWDVQIYRGILTGYNKAFIIDGKKKEELIAQDAKSAEIIRPILRGENIKKYGYEFADLWLINTFPSLGVDIDAYPAVKEHLLGFYDRLKQTGEAGARKKTNNKWFETQDSINYWENFYKPKIVYSNMTKFIPFVFDEKEFLTNQKCFIMTGKKLGFLVAFFNSSLFKYCFLSDFPELQGGTRELSKIFFEKIPIKTIDDKIDQLFTLKIKEIQKLKTKNLCTKNIEIEIDNMIFDLYRLTKEERDIIGFIEIQ